MVENLQIFKCETCGNLVQVLSAGQGELVCCEKPMQLQTIQKNNFNEISEKHVPQIYLEKGKMHVQIFNHPMIDKHYIQFIEVYKKDKSEVFLKYFKPGEIPIYVLEELKNDFNALSFCNIHGLWGNFND